jgi:predicted RNase H-like HicB family nuclease
VLAYTALYWFVEDGVHAEVLGFPGAISCGRNLDDARRQLQGALTDMAETCLLHNEPLPSPSPLETTADADVLESIHLLLP